MDFINNSKYQILLIDFLYSKQIFDDPQHQQDKRISLNDEKFNICRYIDNIFGLPTRVTGTQLIYCRLECITKKKHTNFLIRNRKI